MRLVKARVRKFKSIDDSGDVRFEEDGITCLVGKNESGKTAFLEALYRLNPLPTGHPEDFVELRDYPRNLPRPHDPEDEVPIEATYKLSADEIAEIDEEFGAGTMTSETVTVSKKYSNRRTFNFSTDDEPVIKKVFTDGAVDPSVVGNAATIEQAVEALENLDDRSPKLDEVLETLRSLNYRQQILNDYLMPWQPKFLYFDEYSELPGRASITRLQSAEVKLNAGERTALALLKLARVASESFAENEYEARKASLEWAANQISDEVFAFWTQNKDLAVEFDVDPRTDPDTGAPAPMLEIRVRNARHRMSLNFSERSRGFVWFFSFVAAFSEFRNSEDDIILLLDEPGLGLHASAQNDLLRYIEERLAPERAVIYTTHSPFMVDPRHLKRARTVEDVDREGTRVRNDVMVTSRDTLFPLQAALGYDLAQTLFVGPDNLLVEGPADLIYLQVLSGHLEGLGKQALDPRWVIVPVGGLEKIPTFIALLGAQPNLNLAVVMDAAAGGSQRVNSLVNEKIISVKALIPLTDITGTTEADIEDLFEPSFYLKLLKGSGVATLKVSDLSGKDRLVQRVERALGREFSHYRPARHLLENQASLLGALNDATVDRFEDLFDRVNGLLS